MAGEGQEVTTSRAGLLLGAAGAWSQVTQQALKFPALSHRVSFFRVDRIFRILFPCQLPGVAGVPRGTRRRPAEGRLSANEFLHTPWEDCRCYVKG